jgi:hypothetical protein
MERCVCVKLWIHFIAGDTSGHNNLIGHMNKGWPKFIYQDCRCLFDDLSSPIPMRSLITSEALKQARLTEEGLTNTCKKTISNAFENVPFGDLKYGLLGYVPAEMLHVSGTGLLKRRFGCLDNLIRGPIKKKDKESFLLGTMLPNYSVPCHKGDGGNTLATRYNHKIILVDDTY